MRKDLSPSWALVGGWGGWEAGPVLGRYTPRASCPLPPRHLPLLSPFPFRFCFPWLLFSSSFLHSLVILWLKPTAFYHSQDEGEGGRWGFELWALSSGLVTRGLALSGDGGLSCLQEVLKEGSALRHTDPRQGFPLLQQSWVLWQPPPPVPQSGLLGFPFSSQSGLPFRIQKHTRLPCTCPMSLCPPR